MPDQHEEFSRLLFPHVLDLSPRMSTWTLILFVSLVQHFVQQQWGSQNKLSTCESTTMSFQLQSRLSSQQRWLYNKFFAENKMSSFKNIRDVREPTMALWKSEVTLPQLNIVATKTLNNNQGGVLWQLNEFHRTSMMGCVDRRPIQQHGDRRRQGNPCLVRLSQHARLCKSWSWQQALWQLSQRGFTTPLSCTLQFSIPTGVMGWGPLCPEIFLQLSPCAFLWGCPCWVLWEVLDR